jgi:hypothetical protein
MVYYEIGITTYIECKECYYCNTVYVSCRVHVVGIEKSVTLLYHEVTKLTVKNIKSTDNKPLDDNNRDIFLFADDESGDSDSDSYDENSKMEATTFQDSNNNNNYNNNEMRDVMDRICTQSDLLQKYTGLVDRESIIPGCCGFVESSFLSTNDAADTPTRVCVAQLLGKNEVIIEEYG